jgi:hypothetical protein
VTLEFVADTAALATRPSSWIAISLVVLTWSHVRLRRRIDELESSLDGADAPESDAAAGIGSDAESGVDSLARAIREGSVTCEEIDGADDQTVAEAVAAVECPDSPARSDPLSIEDSGETAEAAASGEIDDQESDGDDHSDDDDRPSVVELFGD